MRMSADRLRNPRCHPGGGGKGGRGDFERKEPHRRYEKKQGGRQAGFCVVFVAAGGVTPEPYRKDFPK